MPASLAHAQQLLLAAVRAAPRPYRMPPLPEHVDQSLAGGPQLTLAFVLDAVRAAVQAGQPAPAPLQDVFTRALAQRIEAALQPATGDPSFQALVLRRSHAEVDEYVRLRAHAAADRRRMRTTVDAIAHPGKLHGLAEGEVRDRLARLHELASASDWPRLRQAVLDALAPGPATAPMLQAPLQPLLDVAALDRLVRAGELEEDEAVRRYRALCSARGPLAGSPEAARMGRSAARTGHGAEQRTLEVFARMAALLEQHAGDRRRYRAVGRLRVPAGFPGDGGKAKDEWDAAILANEEGSDGAEVLLLAEVKAAPAAATTDYWRLLRGLQRLAQAEPGRVHEFASATGPVRLGTDSLRRLLPPGDALPPQVIYCCPAGTFPPTPVLGPAADAVLLSEEASLQFAVECTQGRRPSEALLLPVWDALPREPRLRSALHQYRTASLAREAMLDPDDLLAALQQPGHAWAP